MDVAPASRSRAVIGSFVLLIVACLLADMATPVLPGAFRLSPSESVEVTAGRADLASVVPVDQLLVRVPPEGLVQHGVRLPRPARSSPALRQDSPGSARLLHALAPADPAGASDDD